MKITVHRGTNEIGGTCIEMTSGDSQIILDIGMPLVNSDGSEFEFGKYEGLGVPELLKLGILPPVEGLYEGQTRSVDALFITHAHQDHYGLIQFVHPDVKVYMSEGTQRVINLYPDFGDADRPIENAIPFKRGAKFTVGPFKVSPFLVDHSSYSAFAYQVEAEGKRIFYTGDFRGHGYLSKTLDYIYGTVGPGLDALLMEGTMLGRPGEPVMTEEELSKEALQICQQTDKAVMVWQSSQHVSRVVAFYRAAKQAKRLFVLDVYTAFVLHELSKTEGGNSLPYPGKPGFDDVRVWYPQGLAQVLADSGKQRILNRHVPFKIDKNAVAENPSRIMMFVRKGMESDLRRYHGLHGGTMIYSMWDGYMEKPKERLFLNTAKELGITIQQLHTSGHADLNELKRMVTHTEPKLLIPIHTFHPEAFKEHFDCPIASSEEGRNGIEI